MSLVDMQICLKYLDKISECEDDILYRALSEAIIISYVRPFSVYNKKFHKVTDLKQEFKKQFEEDETKVHDKVCELRNGIIAHSDAKSYDVSFHISELVEGLKIVVPMQRRIPILLEPNDIPILKNCCLKIENYLFNEQVKIKNLLPIGNY